MPSLHSLPPPSKKRKINRDDNAQNIKQLEDKLTNAVANNTSLNPLADLLSLTQNVEDPHDTSKAIYALYRVFVVIITNGKLGLGGDETAKVVKAWIWDRLQTYVDFLGGLLQDDEKFLRVRPNSPIFKNKFHCANRQPKVSALQIMFSLLKSLSTSYTKSSHPTKPQPQFHTSHFRKIVSSLLLCPPSKRKSSTPKAEGGLLDGDVLDLFYDAWFSVHDDIRWFFLRESACVAFILTVNIFRLISRVGRYWPIIRLLPRQIFL